MTRLFSIFIGLTLCCMATFSQNIDLRKLSKEQRDKYLIKLAREVTQTFGPDWYKQGPLTPQVEDTMSIYQYYEGMKADVQKYVGRAFYTVTLWYDEAAQEKTGWTYASKVRVWADSGEPEGIFFGHDLGYNFYYISYREWLKTGVQKDDQMRFQILPEGHFN